MSKKIDHKKILMLKLEIAELIKQKPELVEFQKKIDTTLDKAKNQEERLAILSQAMVLYVDKLKIAFNDLSNNILVLEEKKKNKKLN